MFFHKFFREKAERDRARGAVSKNKNASKDDEKNRRRQRGDDDPSAEFIVDDMADEKEWIGDMDHDGGEDSEEEVCIFKAKALLRLFEIRSLII